MAFFHIMKGEVALCTGYNSPATFPCLLDHKSTALVSHKLHDLESLP